MNGAKGLVGTVKVSVTNVGRSRRYTIGNTAGCKSRVCSLYAVVYYVAD
jgi:hypothetical protein